MEVTAMHAFRRTFRTKLSSVQVFIPPGFSTKREGRDKEKVGLERARTQWTASFQCGYRVIFSPRFRTINQRVFFSHIPTQPL